MNSKHMMMTMACAAALCGSVRAETETETETVGGWNWAMGEGLTYDEQPILSAEVGLAFDSKFLSYGLVDNNDPILTPSASVTFFDWVSFGVEAIYDISRYGRDAGYENHKFKYQELDPSVTLAHAFTPEDVAWLPTTVELELGYTYEHHPKVVDDDTQFITFAVGLPDLWFEPVFSYERDIDRDNGTYLNLEIGHTFALCDSVDLRISAAQGWGDQRRVNAYLEDVERSALMDTTLKGELSWEIVDGVTLSGYVAYTDYLFDQATREASRTYEATEAWTDSWNFTTGVSVAVAF